MTTRSMGFIITYSVWKCRTLAEIRRGIVFEFPNRGTIPTSILPWAPRSGSNGDIRSLHRSENTKGWWWQ